MDKPNERRQAAVVCILLAAITLAVYWQVGEFDFTNFDDSDYVTENPRVKTGLTWENVRWAFTTTHAANWHPLTWLSLMLDTNLGRGQAGVYHVTNLALHILSTIVLFAVLFRATGSLWRSWFVAAMFALHPLHAESVAWIAERKDVLSGLFWMLTMLAYVWWSRQPARARMLLVSGSLAAGLLAKPMLVSLPIVLLLMDFWPLNRLEKRQASRKSKPSGNQFASALLEKLPLFALAAASCVVTYWAQQMGGAVKPLTLYPLGVRLANAGVAYVSYLGKTIWPAKLAAFYPHARETLPVWQVAASWVVLAIATAAIVKHRGKAPYVFVGWMWYLIALIPVIGIVQVGEQAMADRYTYIPLIGIFMAIAWGFPQLVYGRAESKPHIAKRAALCGLAGVVAVAALLPVTYRQVGYWRSSEVLFSHALQVTEDNYVAHNNLGGALLDQLEFGRPNFDQEKYGRTVWHLRESLRIRPGYPEATYNLATALARNGKVHEAIPLLQQALRTRPRAGNINNNLGMCYVVLKDYARAEPYFRSAIRYKPDLADAYNNLGFVLYKQRRYEEALPYLKQALVLRPGDAQAYLNLGNSLLRLDRNYEAVEHLQAALRADPSLISARNNLATAFERIGRFDEALQELKAALELDPENQAIQAHLRILTARAAALQR